MLYPLIIVGSLALILFIIFRSEKRSTPIFHRGDRLSWWARGDLSLKKSILATQSKEKKDDSFFRPPPKDKKVEFFLRGERLFSEQKYLSAEKWFLEAARFDPHDPKIYSRLGTIYLALKNYKDAKESLLNAIKIDPDVASRHFNLALALNKLGENKKALGAIEKALELKADDPKYLALKEEIEKALEEQPKKKKKRT